MTVQQSDNREITVTPAMLAAGEDALLATDVEAISYAELCRVYTAMRRA
jgi:hypothetical protein